MLNLRFAIWIVTAGLTVLDAGMVFGQDYPNKVIRILAAAAGGGADFATRQVAQGISGPLGQPVVVDNRGSGFLAAEALTKAPPDGYTLSAGGASLWVIPLLQKVSYDVIRDFSPISLVAREVSILVVHPSIPVKSVTELIALAKSKPGQLNYGASLTGSPAHLGGEFFKAQTGVNIQGVPYKGMPATVTALISGEVQLGFIDVGLVAPHVKSGRLRALAVTSATPSALAPGLPTLAASGAPGYEAVGLTGLFAPAKTPTAIINRLNQEIGRVLNQPDVKERFLAAGQETSGSSPEQFAAIIRSEMTKVAKVLKDTGVKAP